MRAGARAPCAFCVFVFAKKFFFLSLFLMRCCVRICHMIRYDRHAEKCVTRARFAMPAHAKSGGKRKDKSERVWEASRSVRYGYTKNEGRSSEREG